MSDDDEVRILQTDDQQKSFNIKPERLQPDFTNGGNLTFRRMNTDRTKCTCSNKKVVGPSGVDLSESLLASERKSLIDMERHI